MDNRWKMVCLYDKKILKVRFGMSDCGWYVNSEFDGGQMVEVQNRPKEK